MSARCRPWLPAVAALLWLPVAAPAQSLDRSYTSGMEAYGRGQWELAIQEFEGILKTGTQSQAIYYNLGNAYFRSTDIAGAVWAYESALRLDPGDKDARHNLSLARLRVKDRIVEPEVPAIINLYRSLRGGQSAYQWSLSISLLLLLAGAFWAGGKLLGWRRAGALANVLLLAVALLALVAADSIQASRMAQDGIIYGDPGDPVTAFSAPSQRATALFELHAGAKVAVTGEGNDWLQIELLDGRSGWIASSQLRPL
ncbi:MAG: SH3 domain-containing protein [Candidatus Marinimicrobia bacterium]|nr:SH3 domain-containing protein [Candidatus Neomarinimicrobiota bacterium]